jgi:hypothetical protein
MPGARLTADRGAASGGIPAGGRRWLAPAIVMLLILAGAGGWAASRAGGSGAASAPASVPTGTAAVVRTDLSTTTQVSGTLGYSGSYQVINELTSGTLTALPRPGTVIRRGQSLYEASGTGVPLFYGTRPMWRPIQAGTTPGRDIYQLDQNLIALGYNDYGYLTASGTFTAATAAAISAWQAATGQAPTGAVQPGQVAFEPRPVRVTAQVAAIGSPLQPGTAILTATSTRRSVDVQLPVAQEYLVRRGDRVTITLPDGTTTTPGVIAAVSPVASSAASTGTNGAAANSGSGAGSTASGPAGSSALAGTAGATVDVTVRLADPAAAGRYDQAPVGVSIAEARADNVLAVPVNALVALAGGGYGVYAVDGSERTLLGVRTGLFANTLVQVSAAGLHAGMRVEVPHS